MVSIEPRSTIVTCGRISRASPSSFSRGGAGGCEAWEREPGIDDDDWDPAGIPVIAPWKPEPPVAPRQRSTGRDGWWTEPRRPRRPALVQKVVPVLVPQRDPFGGMFNWDED
jgi:hypothetical protein